MSAPSVDWRNRFGRAWITSVRDQDGTSNCWAFAATALVEAMVRIDYFLWSSRSEGDVVHGVGKQSWDFGNLGEAITFVFLGRRSIAGLRSGTQMVAEGMVGKHKGKLAMINPSYEVLISGSSEAMKAP